MLRSGRRFTAILLGSVLLSLVGVFPFAARAQRAPALYRVGVLNDARAANHPTVDGLKAGLRDLGFEEGRDIVFEVKLTDGSSERMQAAAGAMVKAGVNVIFTSGEAQWRSLSPIQYVREGFPPTMLLHGTADQTIPVEDSLALYQAFRSADVPVELHVIEGVTHVFDAHEEFALAAATCIDLFLDRHVANPRTIPSTEPGAR